MEQLGNAEVRLGPGSTKGIFWSQQVEGRVSTAHAEAEQLDVMGLTLLFALCQLRNAEERAGVHLRHGRLAVHQL